MTTAIAQAVSAALLHFVWQGVLVGSLLWVALFVLRKRSANVRYLVSCLALALMALLPVVTACLLFDAPQTIHVSGPVVETLGQRVIAAGGKVVPSTAWIAMVQAWAVPAWSLGVLLFSLRLIWGCRQVSSLRRRGEPADASVRAMVERLAQRLNVTRVVRVLTTASADSPSVMGWIRPVVLLPSATLLGLTMPQLEAVLAHELAHIRRHDYLANMVQMLVETYLFYHPAVWWTSQRIRQERELCCDDLAVEACGDAMCYARALTKLERLRAPEMAMAGTGGSLLYRIQRLVGGRSEGYGPGKLPGILALCLGLACFGLNVKWAHGQEQESAQLKAGSYVLRTSSGPTRDSAGVSVDLGGAAVLHRTSVGYPESAIVKHVEGTVTIEATLDTEGDVVDARIVSGPVELRKAALQEVLEWHFVPQAGVSLRQVNIAYQLAAANEHQREEELSEVRVNMEANATEQSKDIHVETGAGTVRVSGEHQIGVAFTTQGASGEPETRVEGGEQGAKERRVEFGGGEMSGPIEGRLARIDVVGLSDQVRQQLMSSLPLKLGDTVNVEIVEKATALVKKFDAHLECEVRTVGDGKVAFQVSAPNTRVMLSITPK